MFVEMNYSCDLSWVTKEGKWRPVSSRDRKSWISRANWFRVAEIVIVLRSSQFSLFLNWNCSKGSPQPETQPIVLHDFHGARWRTIRSIRVETNRTGSRSKKSILGRFEILQLYQWEYILRTLFFNFNYLLDSLFEIWTRFIFFSILVKSVGYNFLLKRESDNAR